jgi:hypothetical protein
MADHDPTDGPGTACVPPPQGAAPARSSGETTASDPSEPQGSPTLPVRPIPSPERIAFTAAASFTRSGQTVPGHFIGDRRRGTSALREEIPGIWGLLKFHPVGLRSWYYRRARGVRHEARVIWWGMSKHDKTFGAIFARPTRANIRWDDAVALVKALGGIVVSLGGSAHRFTMPNGIWAVIHKPHPGSQLSKGRVEAIRDLLIRAGGNGPVDEIAGDNDADL